MRGPVFRGAVTRSVACLGVLCLLMLAGCAPSSSSDTREYVGEFDLTVRGQQTMVFDVPITFEVTDAGTVSGSWEATDTWNDHEGWHTARTVGTFIGFTTGGAVTAGGAGSIAFEEPGGATIAPQEGPVEFNGTIEGDTITGTLEFLDARWNITAVAGGGGIDFEVSPELAFRCLLFIALMIGLGVAAGWRRRSVQRRANEYMSSTINMHEALKTASAETGGDPPPAAGPAQPPPIDEGAPPPQPAAAPAAAAAPDTSEAVSVRCRECGADNASFRADCVRCGKPLFTPADSESLSYGAASADRTDWDRRTLFVRIALSVVGILILVLVMRCAAGYVRGDHKQQDTGRRDLVAQDGEDTGVVAMADRSGLPPGAPNDLPVPEGTLSDVAAEPGPGGKTKYQFMLSTYTEMGAYGDWWMWQLEESEWNATMGYVDDDTGLIVADKNGMVLNVSFKTRLGPEGDWITDAKAVVFTPPGP